MHISNNAKCFSKQNKQTKKKKIILKLKKINKEIQYISESLIKKVIIKSKHNIQKKLCVIFVYFFNIQEIKSNAESVINNRKYISS